MYKKFIFVCVLALIFSNVASAALPSLIVHYKFDGPNNVTFPVDSSGKGNDGTVNAMDAGGKVLSIAGAPLAIENGALAIDTNSSAAAVTIPGSVGTSFDAEITIAMWTDLVGPIGAYATPFMQYNADTTMGIASFQWGGPGAMLWLWGVGWGDQQWPPNVPADTIGSWNHWTYSKNANTGVMKSYHNGVKVAESGPSYFTKHGNVAYEAIGCGGFIPWGQRYDGKFDDFRLYNMALPDDVIARIAGVGDPAQAWWPVPDSGATAIPYTGKLLSWQPGEGAATHTLNWGTTMAMTSVVTGLTDPNYPTGTLNLGQQYYWRVDEVNGATTVTGNIWTFTAQEGLLIDDFESYANSAALQAVWPAFYFVDYSFLE